jgi:hypothetical protein
MMWECALMATRVGPAKSTYGMLQGEQLYRCVTNMEHVLGQLYTRWWCSEASWCSVALLLTTGHTYAPGSCL